MFSRLVIVLLVTVFSTLSYATSFSYKCHATSNDGNLADGFTLLTVNKSSAKLEYYYVNTVAHETSLEYSATYRVGQLAGGTSKVAQFSKLALKKLIKGTDAIEPVYLEPVLADGGKTFQDGSRGGFFVFIGHGYSYDWNICSRQ